jgi:PAS domain S-box-containing protein
MEHEQVELGLRQNQELLRLFIEHAPASQAMFDKEMRYLCASRRWLSARDLEEGELLGLSHYEVFPNLPESWKEAHQRGLAGKVVRSEADRFKYNGSWIWIKREVRPWYDASGAIAGIVIFTEDVTEQKRAEQDLRLALECMQESEEHFRHLFEYNVAGVMVHEILYDEHGAIVDWTLVKANPSIAQYLPVPIEQALGRQASDLFGPEIVRDYFQICQEVVDSGQLRQFEAHFPHTDTHHLAWVYAIDKRYYVTGSVDITKRKQVERELQEALAEVERLRNQLEMENIYLRKLARLESEHGTILGGSKAVRQMLCSAEKVAPTDSAVLIAGETGTGKELLARAIHDLSGRSKRVMVEVNCATLPAMLIESELFGREKGAYTGAMTREVGRFDLADGSTIFLDEIAELPLEVQAKFLRVLQEGQFERLGSPQTNTVDVRVIAATNRDLAAMVQEGTFRADLFYRLSVFPITVPALRERVEDIPLLVWHFVNEFSQKMGKKIDSIARKSVELMQQYPWPGNIRELRNVVERAMILSDRTTLNIEIPSYSLSESAELAVAPPATLEEGERRQILEVLGRTGWRVSGRGGAAETLGLKRTTLEARMKKLGIGRPIK